MTLSQAAFGRILSIVRGDDFAEITVGRAKAKIDKADYERLSGFRWKRAGSYAVTDDDQHILMHRMILGELAEGKFVDHIDGDGLNNQSYNLRPCTHAQNMKNRRKVSGASRFKGVQKDGDLWRARIVSDGKRYTLGKFHSQVAAAKAYDAAAIKLHGEFSCTNRELGLL